MSFRLFIYHCALWGGCAAFLAWLLGRGLAPAGTAPLARALVQGLLLGTLVALSVGLVDAFWNLPRRGTAGVGGRVMPPVVVGLLAGLIGPFIAQLFVLGVPSLEGVWRIFGWTVTGLLIGLSVGAYELFVRLTKKEALAGALRKARHGLIGGALGGLLGGVLHEILATLFESGRDLASPGAFGMVALGACIGLLIGLVQVVFKEAWVRVEAGFREGRELMLSKPETSIGRAESSDIALFGDAGVERTHARILLKGEQYVVADAGSDGGTFVNDERVTEPRALRAGDLIRVGHSVLRFGERQKSSRS